MTEVDSEGGDQDEAQMVAELEDDWEPVRFNAETPSMEVLEDEGDDSEVLAGVTAVHREAERGILVDAGHGPKPKVTISYRQQYPTSQYGMDLPASQANPDTPNPAEPNLFAPFRSKLDWDMARWAKLRGPSSTAFSELLAIDGVRSFSTI